MMACNGELTWRCFAFIWGTTAVTIILFIVFFIWLMGAAKAFMLQVSL